MCTLELLPPPQPVDGQTTGGQLDCKRNNVNNLLAAAAIEEEDQMK